MNLLIYIVMWCQNAVVAQAPTPEAFPPSDTYWDIVCESLVNKL